MRAAYFRGDGVIDITLLATGHDDIGPLAGEPVDRGAAETAGAAGHERGAPLEAAVATAPARAVTIVFAIAGTSGIFDGHGETFLPENQNMERRTGRTSSGCPPA